MSTDIVYAVRFGSWFAETICGRSRDSQSEGDSGAQIRPEVCRIMKAIFSGVRSAAAMMRSPSFSRERSSRTTMNSPFSGGFVLVDERGETGIERLEGRGGIEGMEDLLNAWIVSSMESNSWAMDVGMLKCIMLFGIL